MSEVYERISQLEQDTRKFLTVNRVRPSSRRLS